MRFDRHRAGIIVLTTSVVLGALVFSTMGVATARSRAENRWNHVPAPQGGPPSEIDGFVPATEGQDIWQTIVLIERYGDKFVFVDVGEKGDSPGDYGVFRDKVRDPETDEVLGTIDVQCIAAFADQCRGSVRLLGRGQITFDGITPLGKDPDWFAVTGGTGEFLGVGGVLSVKFPAEDYARIGIRLTR